MRGKGVSRFDVLGGGGWRVWTNVEGVVKEVLELSSAERLRFGVLGEGLQVAVSAARSDLTTNSGLVDVGGETDVERRYEIT